MACPYHAQPSVLQNLHTSSKQPLRAFVFLFLLYSSFYTIAPVSALSCTVSPLISLPPSSSHSPRSLSSPLPYLHPPSLPLISISPSPPSSLSCSLLLHAPFPFHFIILSCFFLIIIPHASFHSSDLLILPSLSLSLPRLCLSLIDVSIVDRWFYESEEGLSGVGRVECGVECGVGGGERGVGEGMRWDENGMGMGMRC